MSTTVVTPTLPIPSLLGTTVATGVVAAAITTAVAGAIHATGVPLSAGGEIPLAGFAAITFLCAVIGGAIAAVCNRRSDAPGRRFVQVAITLTVLSCAAPVALAPQASSMISLVVTHLVAAAIVVPVLAGRVNG